jgi:leader peptidase (prepilin peptidase)/N-methyltransferase
MEGILAGAAVGAAVGFAGAVPVRLLPQRIEERLEQPAWTRQAGHPLVLLVLGALLVAACGAVYGFEAELIPALLLVGLLLPVAAIDLAYRVIPNALVLPGTVAGLAVWAAVDLDRLPEHAAAAAGAFAFFLVLAVISPGGMGLGDVKLALMLGAFLGWPVAVAIVAALALSLVPSLAILVRYGSAGRKVGIPFGPFLAAGGVIALLWGQQLLDAWLQ